MWVERDFNHKLQIWGRSALGEEHDMVRRMGPNGAALVLVQDMFGLCSVPSGTEVAGQLQARKTRKSTENVEKNS